MILGWAIFLLGNDLDIKLTPDGENPFTGLPDYPDDESAPEESYAEYARALWDEQEDAQRPLHMVWTQAMLFLTGRQWWEPSPRSGTWTPPTTPSWREQPVSNLCLAYFRTALAKATKVRPAWQVLPASSDPKDIKAASLAEEVLEAKWAELKMAKKLRKAVAWTLTTGNAFLYPFWNTSTGKITPLTIEREVPEMGPDGQQVGTRTERVPADADGNPILDKETGLPDMAAEPAMVDEGDVDLRVYSPFQVRVNAEAEDEDDVTFVLIAEVMSLREIAAAWPEKATEVKAEDVGSLEEHERLMGAVIGGADTQLQSSHDQRSRDLQKALVLHYHERPTPEYPDGRYWCCANKDVLLVPPGPLPDGIWPAVIHMTDVPIPGRYYAQATMEAVIGINREYNSVNGAIKEHHNLMAKGKWIVEKGSGVKKGVITTQPGQVIQVNPGFKIEQAEIKPLPAAVYQERERILTDFEMVSGIHKVSMGKPPPGVTAGVAFLQLQEADDTDLGPFLAMLEEAVAQAAGAFLKMIQANYTDERLIAVSGPNRRHTVRSFRGSDLEGAVDVVPVAESSFPWSKTARQNMLMELASQLPQLFTDPETGQFDSAKFAKALPVGGLESVAYEADDDVLEAHREEEMFEAFGIESMEIPMVEWWQDHEVHYAQHTRVLKSATYKEWPPEAQQAFQQHVMEHDQARMQARMAGTTSPAGVAMMHQQQAMQAEQAEQDAMQQQSQQEIENQGAQADREIKMAEVMSRSGAPGPEAKGPQRFKPKSMGTPDLAGAPSPFGAETL